MTKDQSFHIILFLYETTLPTQLTCRGASCGYPGSTLFTSIYILVQAVSMQSTGVLSLYYEVISLYSIPPEKLKTHVVQVSSSVQPALIRLHHSRADINHPATDVKLNKLFLSLVSLIPHAVLTQLQI